MSNVFEFPNQPFHTGGGSGPEDPTMEQRVSALEARSERIESSLQRLEVTIAKIDGTLSQMPKASDLAAIRTEVAEVKGRISNLPTTWQLVIFAIGLPIATSGLVFAISRFIKP